MGKGRTKESEDCINQTNRALLYIRSVYDYCLDLQADVLYRHADEHGLIVVGLVEDRWGGGIAPRILKDLLRRKKKAKDFDILLVTEITRLTDRGPFEAIQLCRQLRDSGVAIRFTHRCLAIDRVSRVMT